MKETLEKLIELCEVDKALHEVRAQLMLYPKMIAELDAKDAALAKKIAQAEKTIEEARLASRKTELEVKTQRERITKYQIQQNQVKTQKEYDAITHEIAGVKGKIDELDLAGLEALEKEDQSSRERKDALEAQQGLAREHKAERERIASQTAQKKERLAALEAERAERLAPIPEDLQEVYELLNGRFPGAALATASGGSCSGCGMTLIKHLIQDVRHGEKLVRCEGCSRILHA